MKIFKTIDYLASWLLIPLTILFVLFTTEFMEEKAKQGIAFKDLLKFEQFNAEIDSLILENLKDSPELLELRARNYRNHK